MSRRLAPPAPPGAPAVRDGSASGGEPVKVVVTPSEVWPAPRAPAPPGPEPARQTFYAPLVLVIVVSAALLTATMAVLALLLRLHR